MSQMGPKSRSACFCSAALTRVNSDAETSLISDTSATCTSNMASPSPSPRRLRGLDRRCSLLDRRVHYAFQRFGRSLDLLAVCAVVGHGGSRVERTAPPVEVSREVERPLLSAGALVPGQDLAHPLLVRDRVDDRLDLQRTSHSPTELLEQGLCVFSSTT